MSKTQTLRALVNERLSAAADEIFALFERTIAEYEQEVGLYKEQNQKKQELLDTTLRPKVVLLSRADDVVQIPLWNPDHALNHGINPVIKQEPKELSISHEEVNLKKLTPELPSVSVKNEGEEPQRENILDPEEEEGHTSDHDEDWGAPYNLSDEEETEGEDKETVSEDHCYQVKIRAEQAANTAEQNLCAEISLAVNNEDLPGTAAGTEQKKYQCFACEKRFRTKQEITLHERIHTGEKPFSCPFCEKTFAQKGSLQSHVRIHTGEKPFTCPTCNKAFAHKGNMRIHIRKHTGEKPFCCSICGKSFADPTTHKKHMESHANRDAKTTRRLNMLKALLY
ncbi:hypothetical protein WMY93_000213 [Mugilogobius chulae]|uniref:C2H2-type domain-containing protein n=1 Tax=Mugilogobius chulae TaxID=88201 RepID=A0AAW0Q9B6_9GOBI